MFGVAVYEGKLTAQEILEHHDAYFFGNLGTNYCTPVPNSTASPASWRPPGPTRLLGQLLADGQGAAGRQFGIFLAAPLQGYIPGAGGTSNGAPASAAPSVSSSRRDR